MTREYPVLPLIMPSDLKSESNGNLKPSLLRDIKAPNGKLHHLAATAWNALQLAAYFDGVDLSTLARIDRCPSRLLCLIIATKHRRQDEYLKSHEPTTVRLGT